MGAEGVGCVGVIGGKGGPEMGGGEGGRCWCVVGWRGPWVGGRVGAEIGVFEGSCARVAVL